MRAPPTLRVLPASPDPDDEDPPSHSLDAIDAQVNAATHALSRPADDHLVLPFPTLHGLLGAWAPGEIHFGCAFSGGGKTLLVSNLELELLRRVKASGEPYRVYHVGLETPPQAVRTHLACLTLGVYFGDVWSGAFKHEPFWESLRKDILHEIQRQRLHWPDSFALNNAEWLDVRGLMRAMDEAADFGADLVVIDHVDHLAPSSGSLYDASVNTIKALHAKAVHHQLRVFGLSQLNNDAVKGDRLAVHYPPRPEMVYMGPHKRFVATTMTGIYRPLREDASMDELKAVREGRAEPQTVVSPDLMGLVCMKNRNYGAREGRRGVLRVERGRLSEVSERDKHPVVRGYDGPRIP